MPRRSSVINYIISPAEEQSRSSAVAYHYCEFSNPSTLDPSKIVGSLVRQLALQMGNIAPAIQSLYNEYSGQVPPLAALLELLRHMVGETLDITYLIIDGLDECPDRRLLLDGMQHLVKPSSCAYSVKVLLASRPEYDIRRALSTVPNVLIRSRHVELDIETHVRAELAEMPKLRALSVTAQQDLVSDLVKRAAGMFRWIQCQLDCLRTIRTPQALNHALQTLPAGLDETYDRILASIAEEDHEYVHRMLHWLVASERPLSAEELAEAIALNPAKDQLDLAERLIVPEEVFELCGSLIRVEEDQTVVLAHFSVKEYLLSAHLAAKGESIAKFALQPDRSRCHLTMCILSYVLSISLKVHDPQPNVFDEQEFPLLSYVTHVGIGHVQDFDAIDLWMTRHFSANTAKKHDWLLLLDYLGLPVRPKSGYGVVWFVKRMLQCSLMCFWNRHVSVSQHDISAERSTMATTTERIATIFLHLQRTWETPIIDKNASRKYGARFVNVNPLCAAAAFDFEHVARYLLANGCQVNGIPSLGYLGNPMLRALMYGNQGMIRTLVDCGADFNIRSPGDLFSISLIPAALHSSELVAHILEEYKPDTEIVDAGGRTIVSGDLYVNVEPDLFTALLESPRYRHSQESPTVLGISGRATTTSRGVCQQERPLHQYSRITQADERGFPSA